VPVKKNAPALTVPQVHLLVCGVIPKQAFDAQWVLEVLAYWQHRNYVAYRSHRKRRLAQLNQRE
jgi:hypothetical protein